MNEDVAKPFLEHRSSSHTNGRDASVIFEPALRLPFEQFCSDKLRQLLLAIWLI